MTILCGTDFSEPANQAIAVAAQLAKQLKLPLHLLHALDIPAEKLEHEPHSAVATWAENQLRAQAEQLGRQGVQVRVHVKAGVPDQALLDAAEELKADWIVVAALGQRPASKAQLGSHAERVAQRSHIPVLVVREAAPFLAWLSGARPLRVVLGADLSESSVYAARWLKVLRGIGPCELVMVHLYWPPEQFHRLGLGGIRSYIEADPEVTRALERELSERLEAVTAAGSSKYRLEPHMGRIADRLSHLAAEERADVVVVGCHERNLLMRAWEGSVSRGVLQHATTSVACIPRPREQAASPIRKVSSVLVATDFSEVGNEAVALAYAVVAYGGTVHLLHVLPAGPHDPAQAQDIFSLQGINPKDQAAATAQLKAQVPPDAAACGKHTQVHLIQSRHSAAAIAQAAERLNIELICLGTHGRSGLSKAVLGSVAESVLSHTHRPVLFARAQR